MPRVSLSPGPFFIVIFGWLILKEMVGWQQWISVLVGFLGVTMILRVEGGWPVFAGFIALLSSFFFSLVVIWSRKLSAIDPPITISFWANVVLLVVGIVGMFFENWQTIQASDIATFLVLGFSGGISSIMFIVALRIHEASKLAVLEYSIFIWAVIFGYLFFAEIPGMLVYLGMFLIVLGGIYANRPRVTAKQ